MRTVLYADDMEPITVIDLPPMAVEFLKERGRVRLPVLLPFRLPMLNEYATPSKAMLRTVDISAETLVRKGREHMMLFTRDEESALLMKCAFLPGQQAGLQEREREAFARGFLDAITMVGR